MDLQIDLNQFVFVCGALIYPKEIIRIKKKEPETLKEVIKI